MTLLATVTAIEDASDGTPPANPMSHRDRKPHTIGHRAGARCAVGKYNPASTNAAM